MKLNHHKLIPVLPRQMLLQQHRVCCALRGKSWGRKNSLVNYVFRHSWEHLYYYHQLVLQEMTARGYKPNQHWLDFFYRGKNSSLLTVDWVGKLNSEKTYPEHTSTTLLCDYLQIKSTINRNQEQYDRNELYRLYALMKK